ncbi:MAG: 4Fe-4S dicluster domain-containing protein [Planctomycetota bacterium]|jgi:formate dehydrogenase iron-sulfur subunit
MSKQQVGLLFDMVRCAGCHNCIRACMEEQGFEGDPEKVTDLSATAYTSLDVSGDYPIRNLCRHCVNPSCASVCPVAALKKTELGPVVYEARRCMGCRYCIMACPFNIPRYEWDKPVPAVRKCDMCIDRQREGKPTACAEACPEEATVVGPRDELIKLAHQRIKDDPEEYYDHVYGEHEIGGTSVLFLAPYPVEQLGYGKLGTEPLPSLTWNVLSRIPGLSIGVAASLVAFWWITNRRDEVALAEGRKENGNHG